MEQNKEISALFVLIDDPDEEVFGAVSNRIVDFGKGIIPNLENLWENTINEEIQERIELLIHRLHYRDLTEEFQHWNKNQHQDLWCAWGSQDSSSGTDYKGIPGFEKLRRNIWLELNSYWLHLSRKCLTSILYNTSVERNELHTTAGRIFDQ